MDDMFQTLLGLIGGLALFLFGMNLMSESLQKVAGEKMKSVLALLTKNPILGVLAGALTTAVLQSSSATTVMAIGFVSARLMGLPQAISIILGANIGTTMTAQIIAFKISDYIFLFVFLGFLISFIGKKERTKNIGLTIFAFGILFLGIDTMGGSMKPLASSPVFTDMIAQVANIPVLGVAVGTLMTLVVQSSSATIAVLQNFASQPGPDGVSSIIGLTGAIPILLGDNIGTTITALLAAIGQSRSAKRVAFSHCIFNVSGALIFIWIIPIFAQFVTMISPTGAEVDVISRQIANAHTCFNIAMTLIWLPLIGVMVKIVMKILPPKDEGLAVQPVGLGVPRFLDDNLVGQPTVAMQLVAQEILHYGQTVSGVLRNLGLATKDKDGTLLEQTQTQAKEVHQLGKRVTAYLSELFSLGVLTEEQATQTAGLMRVQNDIARIDTLVGEVARNLSENAYSKKALKSLRNSIEQIETMLTGALQAMESGDAAAVTRVLEMRDSVLNLDIDMRKDHMKRVAKGECTPERTEQYNDILFAIDRLGNACVNIVEAANGKVDFTNFITIESESKNDDGTGQNSDGEKPARSAVDTEAEPQPA